MKKLLIVAAIAIVGGGAYIFNQQYNISPSSSVLEHIPADTVIFSGQLEPFPLKDYLTSAPAMSSPTDQQMLNDLYDEKSPKLNFFLNIFKAYQAGLQNPELLIKTFGLPEKLRAYFYTLGLLPVLKTEIENPQAIWDLLDKNERETGVTHRSGSVRAVKYRAYQLSDDNDPAKIELIIAIDKGLLTVTLNSAYLEQTLLETAFGLTKVKNSLADSGKIQTIIKSHNFKNASVGFINHIELLKGFTTTDGNQLAQQIVAIEKLTQQANPLASIRSPECASDFSSITHNWPQTVVGYTNLAVNKKESTLEIATIIESKNQPIINALQAIRGYIPKYTTAITDNVFATALGIDVNQLAVSLTDVWSDLQTPSYSCQPLASLQSTISQSGTSISMLSMGTSLANGVKGIGIAVLDYKIGQINNAPSLENLDALLTLSADNPQQIFNSIKMFSPELQKSQLSATSKPIDLASIYPLPPELNLRPKLAIKGKNLVIYNGEKGRKTAEALATEPLITNGLYHLSFDFKKIFTPLMTTLELTGEPMPEELKFLADYDTRLKMSIDINSQGVMFNSYINNKAAK